MVVDSGIVDPVALEASAYTKYKSVETRLRSNGGQGSDRVDVARIFAYDGENLHETFGPGSSASTAAIWRRVSNFGRSSVDLEVLARFRIWTR